MPDSGDHSFHREALLRGGGTWHSNHNKKGVEGKEETLILDIGINTSSQLEQLSNRRDIFLANMTFLFNGAIGLQVFLVEIGVSCRTGGSFQTGETNGWVSGQEKFLGGSQSGLFTGELVNPGKMCRQSQSSMQRQ